MSSNYDRNGGLGPLEGINPLAIVVPVVIVGIALLLLSRRRSNGVEKAGATARRARDKASGAPRKMALTFIINALENDMMRRVVIMGLKMARSRM